MTTSMREALEETTPAWCGAMVAALAARANRYPDDADARNDVEVARKLADAMPAIAAALSSPAPDRPVVSIKPMRLSGNRTDFYVSIRSGDREVTPHVFRDEEYKAAYHVALYRWLLNGTEKPDLMVFGPDEWPAQVREPEAEPVAWGDSEGRERPIDAEAMKQLRLNPTTETYWSRFSIPLYTSPRLDREKVARALWADEYPEYIDIFDRIAARGGLCDTGETQSMWDKAHRRADAIMRETR